jgi:hypothetical protein
MRDDRPDLVRRDNGSPHPFRGGGLYVGKVTFVGQGNTVNIRIPGLGVNMAQVVSLGTTQAQRLVAGDSVICGFLANDNQDLVVIGRMNIVTDVFATKEELAAEVATLTTLITNLTTRVTALEA